MRVLSWRYSRFTLLLAVAVPLMAIPPQFRIDDPLNSILQITAWILYFVATNGLLFQLWRAPPPTTLRVRCGRIVSILLLGAPTLALLIAYAVTMRDIEVMGLPYVAAPFAIIAPLWVLALKGSFKPSPTPLSEIF